MVEGLPGGRNEVMGVAELPQNLSETLIRGSKLWLFLDYDGTLAEFAPTPDTILPDPDLIQLMGRLAAFPERLRVVIMSGRRVSHIQKLLPVPGILEAGTYGIEYQTWEGEQVCLLNFATERPFLDQMKAQWSELINHRPDYFLEDKGYALAIHARRAPDKEARQILSDAAEQARQVVGQGTFRIEGGYKFLEVAPIIADKGQSISTLLKRFPWPGAAIVYIGDDGKDEEAFRVVTKEGGTAILVAEAPRPTAAQFRLNNPWAVRAWLAELAGALENAAVE